MAIEAILAIFAIIIYIAFPRQTKNLYTQLFKRKDFVICKMKKHNSGFFETWYKVPDSNHIIHIKNGAYYVLPEYASEIVGKRLHFLIDQADAIPEYQGRKDEDIIFQAQELKSTIVNKVAERLFNDKRDMMFYLLVACIVLTFVAVIYASSKVTQMNEILNQMQAIEVARNASQAVTVIR